MLEILLAITITGFVLAAATTMVVSISNIWVNRQDSHFFDDHVDGVAEFVQSCFTNAGVEIALEGAETGTGGNDTSDGSNEGGGEGDQATDENGIIINTDSTGRTTTVTRNDDTQTGTGLIRVSEEPVGWASPPSFASFRDPLLNFKLREQPPLLVNVDNAPALGVDVFLYFEPNEGLSLLWYSILQEEAEDENDLRRTLISPYVTSIQYVYWDERFESWEEESEPKEGDNEEFMLPRFIKLLFEYEGVTKERTLAIPVPSQSALLF